MHAACGGTLCHGCLEVTFNHYGAGAFVCPVSDAVLDRSCRVIDARFARVSFSLRCITYSTYATAGKWVLQKVSFDLLRFQVCSTPVDPNDEYVQVDCMADYKPKIR